MALTTERQSYLLRLRRNGTSVADIADMLNISVDSVKSCLKGAYSKLTMDHEAEEARQLELIRLDELLNSYYDKALEGDEKAADIVFKTIDRRSKLLGLDAPEVKKVDNTFKIGWIDDEEPVPTDGKFAQEDQRKLRPSVSDVGDEEDQKKRVTESASQLTAFTNSV